MIKFSYCQVLRVDRGGSMIEPPVPGIRLRLYGRASAVGGSDKDYYGTEGWK